MLSNKTALIGIGVLLAAALLPSLLGVKIGEESSTPSSKVQSSRPNSLVSRAEQRIKADIQATKEEGKLPANRLAEQEKFAQKALDALHCVHGSNPCNPSLLESHLKGLPIGWVEKVLGEPQGHQKIDRDEFFYWTVRLQEDGRSETYRLQLQYTLGSGDCPRSIVGGRVACKFNFYG